MSFQYLRASLRERLDEADRGDRGWWLVTRVHLSPSRLQQIAIYLHDAGAAHGLALTRLHYRDLASVLDVASSNPRQTINRHYFLAMEKPLRLISKLDPNSWDRIALTEDGVRLAVEDSPVSVFEGLLQTIRFCREPWYTPTRVEEYEEFDVLPYPAALSILTDNGGYIDIDEFDLFVSRVRTSQEIRKASREVKEFRQLSEQQKAALRSEVEQRTPAGRGADARKPYNNWRDMARHTFSLFALGESAFRVENRLFLSGALSLSVESRSLALGSRSAATVATRSRRSEAVTRSPTILRIPDVEAPEDLLVPPVPPQENTGADSELLIGKILAADGWQVVYYSQRRGYGFDLWVQKGDKAFVIEVKSFAAQGSTVVLTPLEYEAARHHAENFLLVVVENALTNAPRIHVIQNPVASLRFIERNASQFCAARGSWIDAASGALPR